MFTGLQKVYRLYDKYAKEYNRASEEERWLIGRQYEKQLRIVTEELTTQNSTR